jgi:hypothetical protein
MAYEIPDAPRIDTAPIVYIGYDLSFCSVARLAVAECMVLAGHVSALFAEATRTPIICRTQPFSTDSVASQVSHGRLSIPDLLTILPNMPSSELTTDAKGRHGVLGLNGYTQITSPLRRMYDLINHWQVKARISGSPLPFQPHELMARAVRLQNREREVKRGQRAFHEHWVGRYTKLKYADEVERHAESTVYDGYVVQQQSNGDYSVFVKQLAMKRTLSAKCMHRPHRSGEWIRLRIAQLDQYGTPQFVSIQ